MSPKNKYCTPGTQERTVQYLVLHFSFGIFLIFAFCILTHVWQVMCVHIVFFLYLHVLGIPRAIDAHSGLIMDYDSGKRECSLNFEGSSGAMEENAATMIWQRSTEKLFTLHHLHW